jgi:hypothetical protein
VGIIYFKLGEFCCFHLSFSVLPSFRPVLPSSHPSVLRPSRPSVLPSSRPSVLPSSRPSVLPSFRPPVLPSSRPSVLPSFRPPVLPSSRPSFLPSSRPSIPLLIYNYSYSSISKQRPEGDFLRTLFKVTHIDKSCADYFYLNKVLDDVCYICPQADTSQMYLIGFSNGGYLACDTALFPSYPPLPLPPSSPETISENDEVPESNQAEVIEMFKERPFKAICLYMGAITDTQIEILGKEKAKLCKFDHMTDAFVHNGDNTCEHKVKSTLDAPLPDVYIVTGHYDPQIFSCHKVSLTSTSTSTHPHIHTPLIFLIRHGNVCMNLAITLLWKTW